MGLAAAHGGPTFVGRVASIELIINGWALRHPLGGIALYVRLLVEALARHDQEISWRVAIPQPHAHLVSFVPPERVLHVDGSSRIDGYIKAELYWNHRIAATVREAHREAVFHSPFHYWSARLPRRLVITTHDCIERRNRVHHTPGRALYRKLCWSAARRATRVIAVSDWTRQDVCELEGVPANKTVTLYNWVRPSFFRSISTQEIADMRTRYRLPEHYVAYLGGYRSYKNVGMLVSAWGLAKARGPVPPLVLAGEAPVKGSDECQVHEALRNCNAGPGDVFMPGVIDDEDLPAFYSGAALFVSPSKYEGFGYPAVEAAARGVPLLVADASAFRELVSDPRLRFAWDDPEALSRKIAAALAAPEEYRLPLAERFTEAYGISEYIRLVRACLR